MKHFVEFVHLLNQEKLFEFIRVTDTKVHKENKDEYTGELVGNTLPILKTKLLKYNHHTCDQFSNYIRKIKPLLLNEVADVFHKEDKDHLVEMHNKYLLLIKLLVRYKTFKTTSGKKYHAYDGMSFKYPDSIISVYDELADHEKNQVSQFLKLEFDLVYETKELIRKLEEEYKYKHVLGKSNKIEGFTFNPFQKIDLVRMYPILNDHLLQTDFDTFLKVFRGLELKRPPKIKWLLKNRNGSVNKYALIYFLEHPIFTEQSEQELIKKIDYIFVESDGKKFIGRTSQNLRHFNNDRKRIYSSDYKEKWKKIVDERINKIKENQ
jgi:hypothetical protein